MKQSYFLTLLIIWIFILLSIKSTLAQTPEKIYGKNKVLKTNDYYLQQKDLWKKEVDINPKNADAWYNYYRASRNAYIVGEENDSLNTKGINRFERLKKIVLEMEKNVPETFEYNYVRWINGNNDQSLFPYLEKAHKISPERSEPLMDLVYYYEIKGDYPQRDKNIETFYHLGEYSPGLLNYSYNMLMGLDKDAIIFTEGDKDTDASLLLQKGMRIREDVKLINVNLLLIKDYRERIFKELGVTAFDIDPFANDDNYNNYRASVIEHFTKNNKNRPIYAAVTVSLPYTKDIKDKLYLTGLAYLYSPTTIDNNELLKKNFEQVYALDYLKVYFPHDISEGNVHRFNENYFLPLAALYKHYLNNGNNLKTEYYKGLAHKIALDSDSMAAFETFFPNK